MKKINKQFTVFGKRYILFFTQLRGILINLNKNFTHQK